MVRSLYSGVSGMQELQEKMDVIGNNIANANTTGYKTARIAFEDTFNQTLRASTPGQRPRAALLRCKSVLASRRRAFKAASFQEPLPAPTIPGIASRIYSSRGGFFHGA